MTLTLKVGGRFTQNEALVRALAEDFRNFQPADCRITLVHGGGAEVTEISRRLGHEPVFMDGVRITSTGEMDIVEMILSGKVNKRLVRLFQSEGINAVGLCGADGKLFSGSPLISETRTGAVDRVNPQLLDLLFTQSFVPVIASSSSDAEGRGININADEAALAIACALHSDSLVFFSDIPGVLKEGRVLASLDEKQTLREIDAGIIAGGMIPKVKASLQALNQGVGNIIIGQYKQKGDLARLLDGTQGTRMHR